jgi:Ca2+-transporting ATPase
MTASPWHAQSTADVLSSVASDATEGLDPDEAHRRLDADGPNTLRAGRAISALDILAGQFRSVVVWVLIGAAVVAIPIGEPIDGLAILGIVALNALIGFLQEYRAARAVASLARLAAPGARVVRGGHAVVVPAAEVVRGDVLVIESGDVVAADARLLEATTLRTNEAALTGESEAVDKDTHPCAPDALLAERRSMIFRGTSVVYGAGRAVVVTTGMTTEVGHIATLLETAFSGETPLEQKLDQAGRRLLGACLTIVAIVFGLGLLRGSPPLDLFMSAVSLAVAAIPEGLPAIVTVALALGVQRMSRRAALVRRLASVETLGCTEVVCTDKTGTLTVGEMTVRRLVTGGGTFHVTGEGYATAGAVLAGGQPVPPEGDAVLCELLRAAAACNDADLAQTDGRPAIVGDPTEGALLVAAAKVGIMREALEREMPRLGTLPFDSDRKRMSVVRRRDGQLWAFVKGAPEVILERCTTIRMPHGTELLDQSMRERMLGASALLASDALRILALAERPLDGLALGGDAEDGLTLLGLIGMQDPPRHEAADAVARCTRAGIRTVMITGDHPDTARAVAGELGILRKGDVAVTGRELEAMSDEELRFRAPEVSVYARVTAEHKLRIVRAWKANGAVVAMTGDGVNDAPALKEASIGIAMGISGTEVTKEAADLIITDDNFASIVAAVEEGRGLYENILKTLGYLLAGNAAELAVMLFAGVVGWPIPLLPIQLLWINLVTDGLPALALATDPIDPSVLDRPPRRAHEAVLDRRRLGWIAFTGGMGAAVTLVAFGSELARGGLVQARNAAFTVLVFEELVRSFSARSNTKIVWEIGILSNMRLLAVVAGTFGVQLAIHQVPALSALFQGGPVTLDRYIVWGGLALVPVSVLELTKLARRRSGRCCAPRRGRGAAERPRAASASPP